MLSPEATRDKLNAAVFAIQGKPANFDATVDGMEFVGLAPEVIREWAITMARVVEEDGKTPDDFGFYCIYVGWYLCKLTERVEAHD